MKIGRDLRRKKQEVRREVKKEVYQEIQQEVKPEVWRKICEKFKKGSLKKLLQKNGTKTANKKTQPQKKKGCVFYAVHKGYIALVTLPERRQRVQALIRHGVPSTIALTRCTLGFQARLDLLWE